MWLLGQAEHPSIDTSSPVQIGGLIAIIVVESPINNVNSLIDEGN